MPKYQEAWDLAVSIIKWGAALIGGICLLAIAVLPGFIGGMLLLSPGGTDSKTPVSELPGTKPTLKSIARR